MYKAIFEVICVICGKCGEKVRSAAKFCPYCGAEISEFAGKFDEADGLFVVKEPSIKEIPRTSTIFSKRRFPVVSSAAAAFLIIAAAVIYFAAVRAVPTIRYKNAEKFYSESNYDAAEEIFSELGDFGRSESYVLKCRYKKAIDMMNNELYPEAADAFTALDGYADSDALARECMVHIAEMYIESGNFDAAVSVYSAAGKSELAEKTALIKAESLAAEGSYFAAADAAEKYCGRDVVSEYIYLGASKAMTDGDFKTAADNFYRLGGYKDSSILARNCAYGFYCSEYAENGASEGIVRGFYFLGDFRDSADMFIGAAYKYGEKCFENGDFALAAAMFRNAGEYEDSASRVYSARYELGKSLESFDPVSARSVFAMLGNYSDSAKRKNILSGGTWYADGFTAADGYYTTVFRKTDVLTVLCTAGTGSPSAPITPVITLTDSSGRTVSAECENIRNSGSFSGSFPLDSVSAGKAEISVSRKDSGEILRTFEITVVG